MNNGLNNIQYDVEACRLSCRSETGSEFFDWVSQDYHDSDFYNTCWCKSSDSGRTYSAGVISGNVNCVDVTGMVEWVGVKGKYWQRPLVPYTTSTTSTTAT